MYCNGKNELLIWLHHQIFRIYLHTKKRCPHSVALYEFTKLKIWTLYLYNMLSLVLLKTSCYHDTLAMNLYIWQDKNVNEWALNILPTIMLIIISMSGSVVVLRGINSRSLMGWICMSFILLWLRGSGFIVMWIVQSSSYQLPSLTNLQQCHVWGSDNSCAVTIVIGWFLDVTFLNRDIPNHTKITAESELWIQFALWHSCFVLRSYHTGTERWYVQGFCTSSWCLSVCSSCIAASLDLNALPWKLYSEWVSVSSDLDLNSRGGGGNCSEDDSIACITNKRILVSKPFEIMHVMVWKVFGSHSL